MRTILIMVLAAVSSCFALRADINGDGRVDLLDLMIMAEEWLMEDEMDYPDKVVVAGSGLSYDFTGLVFTAFKESPPPYNYYAGYPRSFPSIEFSEDQWILQAGIDDLWVGPELLGEYLPGPGATGTATVKKARQPNASGTLTAPGRGKRIRARVRGVYAAIRLSNTNKDESFSFERVVCNVEPRGRVK